LIIRRATHSDVSSIRELTRAAYAKWVPLIGREPLPMAADYDIAVQAHNIDLLLIDGQLSALIETIPETSPLLIENIAVLPAYQGKGYGRQMLAHAEKLAKSQGCDSTTLYTNKRFESNIQFYQDYGYVIDREAVFGDGGIVVHMSKKILPRCP